MKMKPTHHHCYNQLVFFLFILFCFLVKDHHHELMVMAHEQNTSSSTTNGTVHDHEFRVGVVLDMDNLIAKMGLTSMKMAVNDFYSSANNSHKRRLVLHYKDSMGDTVEAASAAIDLIKKFEVQAIIGPISSSQADFMADIGNKSHVPIISFSATSPFVSPSLKPYFVQCALNDSSQMQAIAAVVKYFGWREVVPIYENTDYGNGVLPYLIDAFEEINTRVPYRSVMPPSITDDQIKAELQKLNSMHTRVFVVHMSSPSLGSRVFQKAKSIGMMNEGYSWIITSDLANSLKSLNSSVIHSMQGALGVRPYVPSSKALDSFKVRWKRNFLNENHAIEKDVDLNIFGLWAYDTIWSLASAVEKLESMNSQFLNTKKISNQSDNALKSLGISQIGHNLLQEISNIHFNSFRGEFHLVDRELQSNVFQILNVQANGGNEIGLWTPSTGLLPPQNSHVNRSTDKLLPVIWPGPSVDKPRGWVFPINEKKLRIGIPVKDGFTEFVNIIRNTGTNSTKDIVVQGYCIDVLDAVIDKLPYGIDYEFVPFQNSRGSSNGTYTELLGNMSIQKYDAVVGDVAIIADRSRYVDFTLPYTESGVSMIVPVKKDARKQAWIFLKPLKAELWLTSGAFFVLIGGVVWILEHRINEEFRGPVSHQLGTMFWFSFSTLVFAHREKLVSNWARFVVIIWVFVVLVLTQSYTASLTSMLTVRRLEPTITDVHELIKNGGKVGYPIGSFIYEMLKTKGFNESKLIAYRSPEDFDLAFDNIKGSGIVAAFDEIPYLNLLKARFCDKYTLIGPTYKTGGFGFAFPKGSPLVPDVSRAILYVTQGDTMTKIEQKWFGNQTTCPHPNSMVDSSESLGLDSFWGLFLIAGVCSVLALFIYLVTFFCEHYQKITISGGPGGTSLWQRIKLMARHFDGKDFSSHPLRKIGDGVQNDRNIEDASVDIEAAVAPNVIGLSFSRLSSMNNQNEEEFWSIPEDQSPSYAIFDISSSQEMSRRQDQTRPFRKHRTLRTYSNPEMSSSIR